MQGTVFFDEESMKALWDAIPSTREEEEEEEEEEAEEAEEETA